MRYVTPYLLKDLSKKMVFLAGPRQSGKTTLAKSLLKEFGRGSYFNWDFDEDRKHLLQLKWPERDQLIVMDELHKYGRWKNWIKGVYDDMHEQHRFLVTGSARLDTYRKGGDSLLGRYHLWHLHPFCLAEHPGKLTHKEVLQRLMTVGGFPEPFVTDDAIEAKRWRRERLELVVRQDIRDLENIRDLSLLSLLLEALRERVGGLVVAQNIAQELEVAPQTVARWLDLFERMYLCFKVMPYTRSLPRAVKKPPKVYFFDNGDVIGDQGAVFENLVATHLHKRLQFLQDRTGDRYALSYIRDKEGREVDFVILCENRPLALVEAKWADGNPSSHLKYYREKLKVPYAIQVAGELKREFTKDHLQVVPAAHWLSLPLDTEIEKFLTS